MGATTKISSYPHQVCGYGRIPETGAVRMLTTKSKGGAMYHWMDGTDWFWMSFVMVFWIVVVGAVVYAAVRLAQRPPRERKP